MEKISLIIPYKSDHGRRDFVWPFIQMRYQELFPEVEICLGSDNHELFCKARAVNEAAQKATGDIFVLIDAEVIFDPGLLQRISTMIRLHPWIIPFTEAYRLTKDATDRLIEEGLPAKFLVVESDIEYRQSVPGGYMNVMTRSCFEKVGGMDERFQGYGYEDMAFALSLDTICGQHYRMKEIIYHLWHPWADIYHHNFQNNHDLYQRYLSAAGKPQAMKQLIHERTD
jgi:glycosyltransferase involved in cell wall biosynthesis